MASPRLLEIWSSACLYNRHFDVLAHRLNNVFDIDIIKVKPFMNVKIFKSLWQSRRSRVIPDFPQLKTKLIDCTKRSIIMVEQIVTTLVEFDQQLFDVVQTSWVGKDTVKRSPLRALNVDFQYVDCRLQNIKKKQLMCPILGVSSPFFNIPITSGATHYKM